MSQNAQPSAGPGDLTRSLLHDLLDDASLFPPGNLAMPAAVAAHASHESAWFADLTGPFVCPETKLADLTRALTVANVSWIDLSVVVTGGPGAVAAAIDAVAADPRLRLRAVEVPAAKDSEPAQAITDVAAALDNVPLASAAGYIEYPLRAICDPATAGPLLDLADQRGYRPKLRTGGVTAQAFPAEDLLAGCLAALAGRRMPFKCTAGLHHAVRCTDEGAGLEQHGFLNVMLAVRAAAAGASIPEVAAILAQRDPAAIAVAVQALDADAAAEIRWLFTSFGTCSTEEPIAELVGLGLLSQP
ncbi:MAG: hypothetical protein DLM67_22660 [Candidatus Nephthysia bennettiae]|nr:MAG: hypothetical protein DLM67_22660 [Candidatus Dormibacteraeota bacterium]